MSKLFDELTAASGLSPIFAKRALEQALLRSGTSADALTKAGLVKALPEIRTTIFGFLEKQTEARMVDIERLAKS